MFNGGSISDLQKDLQMFKYLRVSVTDRCNYRCIYCMPEEGVSKQLHSEIMRYEEFLTVIKAAVESGVEQVRITGGEPLVRNGIVEFVADVAAIKGLKDLTLTTNGVFLGKFAAALKKAGLNRVNISIDSLDPENFKKITRNGNLQDVLHGIDAAIAAGLQPVKLNTVLIPGINDHEIINFVDFAVKKGIAVRFIERMPFNAANSSSSQENEYISQEKVMAELGGKYELVPCEDESFGPATTFMISGSQARVGFISSRTSPFCSSCQRLRLTSGGVLLPCLDSNSGAMVKNLSGEAVKVLIEKLFNEKTSWQKQNACYARPFHSSLSKIGG